MATEQHCGPAARASPPGTGPRGARPAEPPSGPSGCGAPRPRERTPAAVEKRGPYMMMRGPSLQAKLQKHRDLAKAALRRKGMLGASPNRPDPSGKSDGELESRYSSGYSSAEVNQDVSRQLLQDGYHLDEIPDDEDLDLIPPKPMASTCSCCWCCLGDSFSCTLQ